MYKDRDFSLQFSNFDHSWVASNSSPFALSYFHKWFSAWVGLIEIKNLASDSKLDVPRWEIKLMSLPSFAARTSTCSSITHATASCTSQWKMRHNPHGPLPMQIWLVSWQVIDKLTLTNRRQRNTQDYEDITLMTWEKCAKQRSSNNWLAISPLEESYWSHWLTFLTWWSQPQLPCPEMRWIVSPIEFRWGIW